jgi:C-terminal processing protease CtpA/Prc
VDPHHLEEEEWTRASKIIEARYVLGGLRSYCNGRVQFGMLQNAIGYLRITTFFGYSDSAAYEDDLKALQTALDSSFQGASKMTGLVIDVWLNHGGDDPLGFEIASRLTKTKYLAYRKVARTNIDLNVPLRFTAPQESWVEPSTRPGFLGNVVLLIGPDTLSAGETFTMALMPRAPQVQRVGLNTHGVFSDVLGRRLPNGWRFRLPNEVYLANDGKSFDGRCASEHPGGVFHCGGSSKRARRGSGTSARNSWHKTERLAVKGHPFSKSGLKASSVAPHLISR